MAPSASKYISLTIFLGPMLFLSVWVLSRFPLPPEPTPIHPSLASLPRESRSWTVYPEDFYEGGNYVALPWGKVRYWLIGPETGQKVVLINGFSVPSIIWKDVAPRLASNGYRVLLYDLYGRGYSDAPHVPYDASLYTTQLALLMQHVRWERANIVAVSMGGGIATAFAASFPHLCAGKFALIASAGLMESSDFSRTSRVMSSTPLRSIVSSAPVRLFMQRLGSSSPSKNPVHEIVQIQSNHLLGYNFALASSLRDGPLRGLSYAYEALASPRNKVLLIWGTADRTVPYRYASRIQELVPNCTLVTVEDGPHDLTLSHPEFVNDALFTFLGSR